jgi:hypothetical protein
MMVHPISNAIASILAFLITYVAVFATLAVLVLVVLGQLVAGGVSGPRATRAINNPFTDTLHWLLTSPNYWIFHAIFCLFATGAILIRFRPTRNDNRSTLLDYLLWWRDFSWW